MASAKPGKYASKLWNKKVLIFGGTSGIGFAVAEAAWEYGASVSISGSNQPKVDSKISQMKSNYPSGDSAKLWGLACDLANQETMEDNLRSLFEFVTDAGTKKLDHIIFCAGDLQQLVPLAETDITTIQKASLIRFGAPVLIAKLCIKEGYLKSSFSSSFTLTGGVNTSKPNKGWSVFAGVGGAPEALTRGLAVDLAPIRVNCVAPGAVETELFDKFGGERRDAVLNFYKEKSLTNTIGRPEDVAEAYLYCMRDQNVTGSLIATNSGYLLA